MAEMEPLIPRHGGYRRLKSFQLARLVYDMTARFCELHIERGSRTRDQMVQAALSGAQNIAEGSQVSGTSKKTELKLTNVARASLEELRLDYEDFLRQRGLPVWPPEQPALKRFRARRCGDMEEVRAWMREEVKLARAGAGQRTHGQTRTETRTDTDIQPNEDVAMSVPVRGSPCKSAQADKRPPYSAVLAANAALSLLNLCCHLLERQVAS